MISAFPLLPIFSSSAGVNRLRCSASFDCFDFLFGRFELLAAFDIDDELLAALDIDELLAAFDIDELLKVDVGLGFLEAAFFFTAGWRCLV